MTSIEHEFERAVQIAKSVLEYFPSAGFDSPIADHIVAAGEIDPEFFPGGWFSYPPARAAMNELAPEIVILESDTYDPANVTGESDLNVTDRRKRFFLIIKPGLDSWQKARLDVVFRTLMFGYITNAAVYGQFMSHRSAHKYLSMRRSALFSDWSNSKMAEFLSTESLELEWFDYFASVVEEDIRDGFPLPGPLRKFAIQVVRGDISRPSRRGHKREDKSIVLDMAIRRCLETLEAEVPELSPTRNEGAPKRYDASDAYSHLDAIVKAAGELGQKDLKFDALKRRRRLGNKRRWIAPPSDLYGMTPGWPIRQAWMSSPTPWDLFRL